MKSNILRFVRFEYFLLFMKQNASTLSLVDTLDRRSLMDPWFEAVLRNEDFAEFSFRQISNRNLLQRVRSQESLGTVLCAESCSIIQFVFSIEDLYR